MSERSVPLDAALEASLESLRLSCRIREQGELPKAVKVKGRPTAARMSQRVLDWMDARWRTASPLSVVRLRTTYTLVVLFLRFAFLPWKRVALFGADGVFQTVSRRIQRHAWLTQEVASYATSAIPESPAVRVSLLLRVLGRHGAAVDVLVRRLRSGLPSPQTRFWLSFLLTEVGEKSAAGRLAATLPADSVAGPVRTAASRPGALKHGTVLLTMTDSDVFRRSLTSLLESDYPGAVVVVEDGEGPDSCREFCAAAGVAYAKTSGWVGSAVGVNLGIELLGPDVEIVLFAHNDVLWPPQWFGSLDHAWDMAYPSGKVAALNLGYVQFKRQLDPALRELFVRGRYDDLIWLLRSFRDMPETMSHVEDCQVDPDEPMFGLSRDPWSDAVENIRFTVGRMSVGVTFRRDVWTAMGGFDPDIIYGLDVELQAHCVASRQLMLFTNNPPLVHLTSSDTRALPPEQKIALKERARVTYEAFERKYGWQIEHYLNLYFSETLVLHRDAIVRAANAGRFDDVDFVFDDFRQRLRERTLANCELTWCRSRPTCRYADAPAAELPLVVQD